MKTHSTFEGKHLTLRYLLSDDGRVGMLVMPAGRFAPFAGKGYFDSLAHVCLAGDGFDSGFSNGVTMRNSTTTQALRFAGQTVLDLGAFRRVTTLIRGNGVEVSHEADFYPEGRALPVRTAVTNIGAQPVTVQLLTSFSMGGLTPMAEGEANDHLKIHRLASFWSAEGRVLSDTPARLNLETSWLKIGYRALRFGQLGSHPVKGYFPFLALEDEKSGVTWGAELCGASSWQMELTRRAEEFCLSGGLADEDFGHFSKRLAPGERLTSPDALVTACAGSYDSACRAIASFLNDALPPRCEAERDLPIVFNEFCTTWGNPSDANIRAIADRIAGRGMRYFVIDAGWYARPEGNWETDMGDWQVSGHMFPEGIRAAADYIRSRGMIPGLWFELENVGPTARAGENTEWLLKRDGRVIRAGLRRMLDLENPEVTRHLDQTVLGLLKEGNFGYLKVDYNESIGVGCDGYESLGEGLRRKVLANQAYLARIAEELPGLVVENCASGGHRLVPSMFAVSDMSSFSDAHECPEIPLIAANTALLTPARHNQIWAVLRAEDTRERLCYSLSAAMLGRMCLSGDVHRLADWQWAIVDESIAFYDRIRPILARSDQYVERRGAEEYRRLTGWQAVRREGENAVLLVAHNFGGAEPVATAVPGLGRLSPDAYFGIDPGAVEMRGETVLFHGLKKDSGCALVLGR